MKVYSITPTKITARLSNIIVSCMRTESDYETLKCKTDDVELFQWVESKQESTTDFILSALSLLEELNPISTSSLDIKNDLNLETVDTKSLIVNLEPQVLIRECQKIDEAHWHYIIEEMNNHASDSKIYKLLNNRLQKLNYKNGFEKNPPLLVG